ncbi:MAG: diaminopropionate ammonia-lyase [Acidimicrobiales bacterium]
MSSAQAVAPATGTEFAAVVNPLAGPVPRVEVPTAEVLAFHRRLPGYEPTPLLSVPALAERLGVASLLVKAESSRFGLPAFKMLGASWAVYQALRERLGADPGPWHDVDELAERLSPLRPFTLVAATDGNHGRAVARMARLVGLGARIFVPSGTTDARIAGIAGEGAEVIVVPGNYDAAVARSAEEEGPRSAVISDTSWPGYREVPRWVTEGYSTMFAEIDSSLAAAGRRQPDAVVVPIGVGALAAAAVEHAQRHGSRGALVGVEPTDAACATASALAGELVTLRGEQHSIMAGLNCGTPSPVAWPLVSRGMTGFLTIGDEWARRAVRELAAVGVEAGETGAAALGGLDALRDRGGAEALERVFAPTADVLVLVTEGASDLGAWRRILGVEVVGTPGGGAP